MGFVLSLQLFPESPRPRVTAASHSQADRLFPRHSPMPLTAFCRPHPGPCLRMWTRHKGVVPWTPAEGIPPQVTFLLPGKKCFLHLYPLFSNCLTLASSTGFAQFRFANQPLICTDREPRRTWPVSPLLCRQEPKEHEVTHRKLGHGSPVHPSSLRLGPGDCSHPSFLKCKMGIRIASALQVVGMMKWGQSQRAPGGGPAVTPTPSPRH